MLHEQDVFIADSQDIKEAVDEVTLDADTYVSRSTQLFVAGLFLSFVMGLSAGCYIMAMLQAPCAGG